MNIFYPHKNNILIMNHSVFSVKIKINKILKNLNK